MPQMTVVSAFFGGLTTVSSSTLLQSSMFQSQISSPACYKIGIKLLISIGTCCSIFDVIYFQIFNYTYPQNSESKDHLQKIGVNNIKNLGNLKFSQNNFNTYKSTSGSGFLFIEIFTFFTKSGLKKSSFLV